MNFFDPPKFPEPFKPEPLWQMNTCPDCKNDLVCHDQGECLRPTPETDAEELHEPYLVNELPFCVVRIDFARNLERQRNEAREELSALVCCILNRGGKGIFNMTALDRLQELKNTESELYEARELLASEKATRNAIIAKGIETERQLAEAREAFVIATDQLVQVQSKLRRLREENARLEAQLEKTDKILDSLTP